MKAPESYAEFLALPDAERERLVKSMSARSEPNKPRMVCQGCCKRAVEAMDAVLAITQNPRVDGAADEQAKKEQGT